MKCWLWILFWVCGSCAAQCTADTNLDGLIDAGDLPPLLSAWASPSAQQVEAYDLNGDSRFNLLDLVDAVNLLGTRCGPHIGECQVFPADNIWNTPIEDLPLHASSAAYVASIGSSRGFHMDFGSGLWNGGPIGIPYVEVGADQPAVAISFLYEEESDPGPYPIPPDAPIEGGPDATGDRHVLILDRDNCKLYEIYRAFPNGDGTWSADSGAIYDLGVHALRPDSWTSADAAGLPILPGLVRYEELEEGEIRHAIRFTAPQTQRLYLWPARHYASSSTNPALPPMGLRLRLRADYPLENFSPRMRTLLLAFQRYGIILADNGSAWYVSGVPDPRWDNDELHTLDVLTGADFEAVDASSLMIHPDSGQALQP